MAMLKNKTNENTKLGKVNKLSNGKTNSTVCAEDK